MLRRSWAMAAAGVLTLVVSPQFARADDTVRLGGTIDDAKTVTLGYDGQSDTMLMRGVHGGGFHGGFHGASTAGFTGASAADFMVATVVPFMVATVVAFTVATAVFMVVMVIGPTTRLTPPTTSHRSITRHRLTPIIP